MLFIEQASTMGGWKVTYYNLRGQREQLHKKGQTFSGAVAKFMGAKGYYLIRSSEHDGILADLVFRRAIEGELETWVECKNTDLSLSDDDFLRELGEYYEAYHRLPDAKRFKLFIFARKCKAEEKWKKLFEEHKQDAAAVQDLRDGVASLQGANSAERKIDPEIFHAFLCDITIVSGDIADINLNAEQQAHSNAPTYERELLEEKPLLIHREENLLLNAVKLKIVPSDIWYAKARGDINRREFWQLNRNKIGYFHGDKLYSLTPLKSSEAFDKYCDPNSITKIELAKSEIPETERPKIVLNLVKQYILDKASKIGCTVYHDESTTHVYFKHDPKNFLRIFNGRRVAKTYRHSETKKVNFVRHDGLIIMPQFVGGECYVFFDICWLFTYDGNGIITGDRATDLHHKFPRTKMFNDIERSKIEFWVKNLKLQDTPLFGENALAFSGLVMLKCPITYEGGEEFDTTLIEYFEENDVI